MHAAAGSKGLGMLDASGPVGSCVAFAGLRTERAGLCGKQPIDEVEVVAHHAFGGEVTLDGSSARCAVELANLIQGRGQLLDPVESESGDPVLEYLRRGARAITFSPRRRSQGPCRRNVAYYEPRTSHGSSLSPAIHASLLARVGRFDEALRLFTMACRLDLDNLNHSTANGLHTATFGGVRQALVFGFAGIRPTQQGLVVDPHVPDHWQCLRLHLRFRGRLVKVAAGADSLEVSADGPVPLAVGGAEPVEVGSTPRRWQRTAQGWGAQTDTPPRPEPAA